MNYSRKRDYRSQPLSMPSVSIVIQKDTIIAAAKLASAAQQQQLSIEQVLTRSLRQQLQPTSPNKIYPRTSPKTLPKKTEQQQQQQQA